MRRLDEAIRLAKYALDSLDGDDMDRLGIESMLVSHCIVLLYSECEQEIKSAIKMKCHESPNRHVASFAESTIDSVTGKMQLTEIHRTLRRFCESVKDKFCSSCASDADPIDIAWDRMYQARKKVAHYGEPAGMTLEDLESDIQACRRLITYYKECLRDSEDGLRS